MTTDARIPQERLNQIAHRKLGAIGVDCKMPRDASPLRGELAFRDPPLFHPLTKKRIERVEFVLVGHDKLRVVDPPVFEGTGDIPFFEAADMKDMTYLVARVLDKRAAEVQNAAAMLRLLNIDPRIDQEQLVVSAILDAGHTKLEVSGHSADAMAVTRLISPGRGSQLVDPEQTQINLAEFPHKADLEVHLGDMAQALMLAAEPSELVRTTPDPRPKTGPRKVRDPSSPPTLGELALKFGAEAELTGAYQIGREVVVGGARRRFSVTPVEKRAFLGKVESGSGKENSERFDLDRFPGVEAFTAALAGLEMGGPPKAPDAPPPAPPRAEPPLHSVAQPGELWVMNVVMESDDGSEVRYVPVDVDGKPFGAPRVLKKVDFIQVFAPGPSSGWLLRIQITSVDPELVHYQQVDRSGAPMGAGKQMRATALTNNFLPEAAAY